MKIEPHKNFLKAYDRLSTSQRQSVDAALLKFSKARSDPSLKDHALKGKMKRLRAFSAAHDLRIIYREEGGFITVILLDAGTHNQVY